MTISPVSGLQEATIIVDPTAGHGNYTTIATALTAAVSGQTILVKPGTYTENPTLKAGVNLVAFDADAITPNVVINGKCTFTGAGTVTISGINLQTNSDYCLAVTGSAASIVYLKNSNINCSSNTGINYSSSSGSSAIYVYGCGGGLTTTGVGLYTMSSAGQINFAHCEIGNSGSSTTASSNSSGNVSFYHCDLSFPLSTSSTGNVNFYHTDNICGGINTTAITTAGSGVNLIYNSYVTSGTASAISVGTGTTVEMANSEVSSSNTNAITGAGTLIYGGVVFTGSSSTINTTTQTPIPWPVKQGGTGNSAQDAYSLVCGGTTTTGAFQAIDPVATGQVLVSSGTTTLPAFSATPTVTSIKFGSGSALSNYVTGGTFTPTLTGQSVAGTTTYTTQSGFYTTIGNIVICIGLINISAATGTGNALIGGLPFTVASVATPGTVNVSSAWVWPVGTTMAQLLATATTTSAVIACIGSATSTADLQMTNAAAVFRFTLIYLM